MCSEDVMKIKNTKRFLSPSSTGSHISTSFLIVRTLNQRSYIIILYTANNLSSQDFQLYKPMYQTFGAEHL